jgi:hypothetical protein
MQGLMMHCGAEPISINQVQDLLPPEPTQTHFPIPHIDIYNTAVEKITNAGYGIGPARHYTNREHQHYFALLELNHEDQEHATMLALRNSYDKIFRASLAIGARVFVCDNLSFSGDIVVGHKNTINGSANLPERFEEAVSKIRFMQKRQEIRFDEYKHAPMDDKLADHLTMECYRRGIVNLQRIGKVNREWYQPSADHGDKTVWRFFNATTAALKSKSVSQLIGLPKKTIDLHLLLDEWCDVELPQDQDEVDALNAEHAGGWLSRLMN